MGGVMGTAIRETRKFRLDREPSATLEWRCSVPPDARTSRHGCGSISAGVLNKRLTQKTCTNSKNTSWAHTADLVSQRL
jgi:hypothetical protein